MKIFDITEDKAKVVLFSDLEKPSPNVDKETAIYEDCLDWDLYKHFKRARENDVSSEANKLKLSGSADDAKSVSTHFKNADKESSKPDATLSANVKTGHNDLARKLMDVYRESSHKKKKKNSVVRHGDEFVVEDTVLKPPKPWLPELGLFDVDKECLLSPVGWITDSIVNAVQKLLHQQFPHIGGFQPVELGLVCNFNIIQGEFIQILHSPGHWITISTVGLIHPHVAVFDSLYNTVSTQVSMQIATILSTEQNSIQLQFMDVQQQSGSNDCGLYAIANATALAYGRLPHTFHYDQSRMRGHLYRCLKRGEMTLFPHKKIVSLTSPVIQKESLPVFCVCRMPEILEMIECTRCECWYHISCQEVAKEAINESTADWLCSNCIHKPCFI